MLKQKVVAATDVTRFGLLGHLCNMLKASSTERHQILGARLSFSKTPTFKSMQKLLEKGLCPAGFKQNRKVASPLTTFDKSLGYEEQLLLVDAQTSGGLLMAVPEHRLDQLLLELEKNKIGTAAVIGQVIEANPPARIHI